MEIVHILIEVAALSYVKLAMTFLRRGIIREVFRLRTVMATLPEAREAISINLLMVLCGCMVTWLRWLCGNE